MYTPPVIVWFRYDLRIDDHPALKAAAESGRAVVGVFVHDDALDGRPLGGAARWWLHHSLARLRRALHDLGPNLLLFEGNAVDAIAGLVTETEAPAVYWNAGHTPFLRDLDAAAQAKLDAMGVAARICASDLIAEPDRVRNGQGAPYKVFTPFWRHLQQTHPPAAPLAMPGHIPGLSTPPRDHGLDALGLLPTGADWTGGLKKTWTPGEAGAQEMLQRFLETTVERYPTEKDSPAADATSRLSPHLRFGEISARRVFEATMALRPDAGLPFLRQIGWREFNHHLLFQEPRLHEVPLRAEFAAFPWQEDETGFRAWCRGKTGYPIVDAGMRELWQTGWMHNRVRMIVGSFLVKDLLIPWQWGERWFWDTLVDACPANNPANWQWVAGCGTDAAPYFRIFNPTLQGEKFDPRGHYVRRWVPELRELSDLGIHRPATRQADLLQPPGYPAPIVDHGAARRRALQAYQEITQGQR